MSRNPKFRSIERGNRATPEVSIPDKVYFRIGEVSQRKRSPTFCVIGRLSSPPSDPPKREQDTGFTAAKTLKPSLKSNAFSMKRASRLTGRGSSLPPLPNPIQRHPSRNHYSTLGQMAWNSG